jgi:hypothetical protein
VLNARNGIFHNLNSHRDNPLACLASPAQPVAWETALSRRLIRTCAPGRKVQKRLLHAENIGDRLFEFRKTHLEAKCSKERLQSMACKPWLLAGGFSRSAGDKSEADIASPKEASLQGSIGGMASKSDCDRVCGELLPGARLDNFNKDCCSVCNFKRSGRGNPNTQVDALDGSGSWTLTDCSIQLAV